MLVSSQIRYFLWTRNLMLPRLLSEQVKLETESE